MGKQAPPGLTSCLASGIIEHATVRFSILFRLDRNDRETREIFVEGEMRVETSNFFCEFASLVAAEGSDDTSSDGGSGLKFRLEGFGMLDFGLEILAGGGD